MTASRKVDNPRGRQYDTRWGQFPSVNTILNKLAKPGLTIWLERNLLIAALENMDMFAEMDAEYRETGNVKGGHRQLKDAMPTDKRDLGSAVHEALELIVKHEKDVAWVDKIYGSTVASHAKVFHQAVESLGLSIGQVEEEVANPDLRYAGTPDAIGTCRRLSELTMCAKWHVIDWKTGDYWPEYTAQLAAYADCTHYADGEPIGAAVCRDHALVVGVHAKAWTAKVADLSAGRALFNSALAAYWWEREQASEAYVHTFRPIEDPKKANPKEKK